MQVKCSHTLVSHTLVCQINQPLSSKGQDERMSPRPGICSYWMKYRYFRNMETFYSYQISWPWHSKKTMRGFGVINLGSGKKKFIVKWMLKDPETLPASWMCSRPVLTVNMFPKRKESAVPAIKTIPHYPVSLV